MKPGAEGCRPTEVSLACNRHDDTRELDETCRVRLGERDFHDSGNDSAIVHHSDRHTSDVEIVEPTVAQLVSLLLLDHVVGRSFNSSGCDDARGQCE